MKSGGILEGIVIGVTIVIVGEIVKRKIFGNTV